MAIRQDCTTRVREKLYAITVSKYVYIRPWWRLFTNNFDVNASLLGLSVASRSHIAANIEAIARAVPNDVLNVTLPAANGPIPEFQSHR